MRISSLLSVAGQLAFLCAPTHASLFTDLRDYRAAHPDKKVVSTGDEDFVNWQSSRREFGAVVAKKIVPAELPKAYIVRLQPGSDLKRSVAGDEHVQFHQRASASISYSTRHEFKNPSVFFGVSINVNDNTNLTDIKKLPNVLDAWPVRIIDRPAPIGTAPTAARKVAAASASPSYTAIPGQNVHVNSPHEMTGVDRLHAEGIKGKGIKIALMDTGVDYYHPALGGCFGSGCAISFGYDFVGDDYGETGVEVPDPDPLAQCATGGHGSHTTGIIGMKDPEGAPFGLVGVAPEAELGMYRVFGCDGGAPTDVMILAFQQAVQDKVDVLSISIGSNLQFEADDLFADVTTATEAAGVAVVVAAGNLGLPGWPSTPAVGEKVIAVGSVDNSYYPAVYTAFDSNNNSIIYSGNPWPFTAPDTGFTVYDMKALAANTSSPEGCADDAMQAAAAAISDKENSIIAFPTEGWCSWSLKWVVASEYGFVNFMSYVTPDADIYQEDLQNVDPQQGLQGMYVDAASAKTVLQGISALGEGYKLFFNSSTFNSYKQVTSGLMSNYSSIGPTLDTLEIKPQLSAPGESILSTWPLEATGYAVLSGTSMATPYAAGVFALIKSQFPGATVQQVREILQSTAQPIPYTYNQEILASVAQQGSGLINAWAAIHASTRSRVSPSELNLGDLDKLTPRNITIENTGRSTKTYKISHDGAGLLYLSVNPYTLTDVLPPGEPGSIPIYASVTYSETSITIPAGQSATFTATFAPPTDYHVERLPTYSGYITVASSCGEKFVIPYLGVPYSRYNAHYIDTSNETGYTLPLLSFFGQLEPVDTGIMTFNFSFANGTDGDPGMYFHNLQSMQYLRLDMVPWNTSFVPDYYGFSHTPENPYGLPDDAYPMLYPNLTLNGTEAGLELFGLWSEYTYNLEPGMFLWGFDPTVYDHGFVVKSNIVDGDYRVVLRMLRLGGDVYEEKAYESWMSAVVRVRLSPDIFG